MHKKVTVSDDRASRLQKEVENVNELKNFEHGFNNISSQ